MSSITRLLSIKAMISKANVNIVPISNSTTAFCTQQNVSTLFNVNQKQYRLMSSQHFEEAKKQLNSLTEDPGNDVKLRLYGLYKQATEGTVQSKRPGMTDFVGRAKWDAWNIVSSLSREDAQKTYVEEVEALVKAEQANTAERETSAQAYKYILVECQGGLRKITLNRPKKKNALVWEMYHEWVSALEEAASDPNTVITTVTGAGDYYCSGNDLSNFTSVPPEKFKEMATDAKKTLIKFVGAFIDFPKPLIAVVNGPAVGVSVTTLGLFDAVYATDRATFDTPFTALGQSPEGCSSAIFPRLMGFGKASELLFFNKKISARTACDLGLVTEVFADDCLQTEVWPKIQQFASIPKNSLFYSKELVRGFEREYLHKVNVAECTRLEERWPSEDCITAVTNFFSRKKN